eukprot:TRINITY_DN672_c0_g1_i1.p1 TRINITY_DN672_c0_g1~~TRINITY_DN672_c0_g1_i1.p1  ORF type:complete len:126 (+),score=1.57 TRINITY_DN672_c0_g1_i1:505-882(+)
MTITEARNEPLNTKVSIDAIVKFVGTWRYNDYGPPMATVYVSDANRVAEFMVFGTTLFQTTVKPKKSKVKIMNLTVVHGGSLTWMSSSSAQIIELEWPKAHLWLKKHTATLNPTRGISPSKCART